MSANSTDLQTSTVPLLSVTQDFEEVRPLFRIDARGDTRPRLHSMASGDSAEAVTEFARRRTMLDIIQHSIIRRRNSHPIIVV